MTQVPRFPFVVSSANRLGTGKLISHAGDRASVAYFVSPTEAEPLLQTVPKASLKRFTLPPQTRVFFRRPGELRMRVGTILHAQETDGAYLVRFPNDDFRILLSDELETRCRLPVAEPTDYLADQVNESAFWHAGRSRFVKHVLEQRRNARGLDALISSAVEFVPHQFAAVRRVLLDPFQRYLLADEVGLGKTIESCTLLKQHLADEGIGGRAVAIVPKSLVGQWRRELSQRFKLSKHIGKTLQIIESHDVHAITHHASTATMLVVDEAHHLASWAWSTDPTEAAVFRAVQAATADLSRRVLLLSATPALRNERAFLAMLHLLDPQVHALDELDAFQNRVRLRQEIAECMATLDPRESNLFLARTLDELARLLTGDAEFDRLRSTLSAALDADVDEADPKRNEAIIAIRHHVGDMWRLHRRIIRSRRDQRTSVYLIGRSKATTVGYHCLFEERLETAVNAWRVSVSVGLLAAPSEARLQASLFARNLHESAATAPAHASELATERISSLSSGLEIPWCEDEIPLLETIVKAARVEGFPGRMERLAEFLQEHKGEGSFVVFVDRPTIADRLANTLAQRLKSTYRVLRHQVEERDWGLYLQSSANTVLVCDQLAEEGLNLQRRGTRAIHFDLPFSPNRIEQRIGRLDRFGVGTRVESIVMRRDNSDILAAWFDLLDSGLGVFQRSIASLQYVVDETLAEIWREFVDTGEIAFRDATARLQGAQGKVARELKRIRDQDALDAEEHDPLSEAELDLIDKQDFKLSLGASAAYSSWLLERLHFRRTGEEGAKDKVFAYQFCRRIDTGPNPKGRDTLLPDSDFHEACAGSIDDLPLERPATYATVPLTFDRQEACRRLTRLLRPGDPFVDGMEALLRRDDRGTCFAFWRTIPECRVASDPEPYFHFDYIVAPADEPFAQLRVDFPHANFAALQRRTWSVMPPRFVPLWLGRDWRVLSDPQLLEILEPAYQKCGGPEDRDVNLNPETWRIAAEKFDMSNWRDLCRDARRVSEATLREHAGFRSWTKKLVATVEQLAQRTFQQYRTRLSMASGAVARSLAAELDFEYAFLAAQVAAIERPDIRADSVGVVFLASSCPFPPQTSRRRDEDDRP
jgi:ATP-dependent helicase HepA